MLNATSNAQAQKEFEKQAAAEEQSLAVMASFPAKLIEVVSGAAIPAHELTSKKLKATLADHEAAVFELRQQATAGVETVREALAASANSATYGDVFNAIEACQCDKANLAQQAVAIWSKSCELAAAVVDDLKPQPAKLEAKADEVIAEVKRQLTEIGSGLENMPAYRSNSHAAEKQFEHQVRFTNGRVRAALNAAKDAKSQLAAATNRLHVTHTKLEAAKRLLHAVVVKAIND